MALSEIERCRAEKLIAEYCEQRVLAHVRRQVQMLYKRRGNVFTLYEWRPYWLDESQLIDADIARIAYDEKNREWRLQYRDRNERWQTYAPLVSAPRVEELLDEIDEDPTGIFWG